ncbi:hypothetical protein LNQ52_21545 [Klebsiella pneumoniae subsp. pneumoniae]|nr:hypothetical protein [Klebsiella pneumoniae subsp. pneumoniae]
MPCDDRLASKKLSVFIIYYFYSKTFDTILQLDEFPDSALQGESINVFKTSIEKVKDYYIDYSIESAFKFTGPDQVIVVDEKLENLRRRFRKQMIMEILS